MGLADDFIAMPTGFKFLLVFAILLGAGALSVPLIGVSIGALLFTPFFLAFDFFGVFVTFELFVILFGIILVILFQIWVLQILLVKK